MKNGNDISKTIAAAIDTFNTLPSTKSFDRAIRVIATLRAAGFNIVRTPAPRSNVAVLYTFNWTTGGFNSVHAKSKAQAIQLAEGHDRTLKVDPGTVVRRASKASQDAYYKALPLLD